MAPCALLLRCIDILYILNFLDSALRLLAGLFGLAVRATIVVFTIYDLFAGAFAAVVEFLWEPYQFLWDPHPLPVVYEAVLPGGGTWWYTPLVTMVDAFIIDMVCVLTHALGAPLALEAVLVPRRLRERDSERKEVEGRE